MCSFPFLSLKASVVEHILATSDVSPFSSEYDTSKGYVNEIIKQVFEDINEPVKFEFYPHSRAIFLAQKGEVEGAFPVHADTEFASGFYLSDPIPAGKRGYLIRREVLLPSSATQLTITDRLKRLGLHGIGYIRGTALPSAFDKQKSFSYFTAKSADTLLDMLDKGRLDVVFIDKYSAKESLINERPNLIGKFVFLPDADENNGFHLALSRNYIGAKTLIDRFNEALHKRTQSGFVQRTLEKYGIYDSRSVTSNTLVVGAPNINAIVNTQAFLEKYDSPFSGVNIQWRVMDETILRRRMLGDFAVNENSFDLVLIGNYGIPIWARRGALLPFDSLPKNYDIEDVFNVARAANTVDGALYGVPFVAETTLTFYRQDLLEKAGLALPSVLTYENLIQLAATLHQPEKEIYGIGLRTRVGWGQNMALLSTMVNTFGGKWFDDDMRPQLTSPEWLAAVNTYAQLLKDSGPSDNSDLGWQENQLLFAAGKLAFFVDASSLGGSLFDPQFSKVYAQTGVTYAPVGIQKAGAQWFWSWNFAIPVSSKHVAHAQSLAYWLTSKTFISALKNNMGEYAAPSGTRHSTYSADYQQVLPYASYEYEALKALSAELKQSTDVGRQFVPIPEFTAIGYAVGVQVNAVISGKVNTQEALSTAQSQTEAILLRAGYDKDKLLN
ncbi:hypothetical protein D210916BOD24_02820 [Alteromonas sp. D210916BOD_24]|uniref:extracellular solute-binding protein n=1 Tax=Alteromonas sp. D210916BOD_24 TaxID=3157618 RepID=UPI00399CC73B